MSIPEISVHELQQLSQTNQDYVILDVRNHEEYAICHLNSQLIPLHELENRWTELSPDVYTVVYCHLGGRSRQATEFLLNKGFKRVVNLRGGIDAWAKEIDKTMPIY